VVDELDRPQAYLWGETGFGKVEKVVVGGGEGWQVGEETWIETEGKWVVFDAEKYQWDGVEWVERLPKGVKAAEALLGDYATDWEVSQTAEGVWMVQFTTPEGQVVELKDVSVEKRTMEPQNWVENYNDGKVLLEGEDEQGRLWRVVEKNNGEWILMYDHQISYLSDKFPFILYSYDKDTGKFQAYVEPPGNGRVEEVHLTWDTEQEVWRDEEGEVVQVTNFTQRYADHYGWTELDLQRITIDNWEVMAVKDREGRQWEIKDGRLYLNDEVVEMPEVEGEATPSSLALREEDGKWYVMDERGLARWVIEGGEVRKYRRPVPVGVAFKELLDDWEKRHDFAEYAKRMKKAQQQEIGYDGFGKG